MGTINYKSNDYITVGINPDRFIDEYEKETEIEFLWEEISKLYNKYDFNIFNISVQPGYYEGFYIDIENDYLYYDNWDEKREALKELTRLKEFLLECVEWGLVAYSPGWCTGYFTELESIKKIKSAIKEMKEAVKRHPTYLTYKRGK